MTHQQVILKKMFEVVGLEEVDTSEEGWYLKHTWTQEQRAEFSEWMQEYLKQNRDARTELMRRPVKNKETIARVIKEYIANYGWADKKTTRREAERR